ncbi:hypothetical protein D3C74_350700 [compost metagenome]
MDTDQFDKMRIAADEPKNDPKSLEKFNTSVEILKSMNSNIQFKLALDKENAIDEYQYLASNIATSFSCTCNYHQKLDENKERLWYVCNAPDKPNTFLHSPLAETRLIGSLTVLFGYQGFLRWGYTCWTKNPREDIRFATQGFPVGDLNLVYPEENGDIALSLRYKALKRAVEDYELYYQLRKQNKTHVVTKAFAMVQLNTNTNEYMRNRKQTHDNLHSLDYQEYDRMRNYLIQELIS